MSTSKNSKYRGRRLQRSRKLRFGHTQLWTERLQTLSDILAACKKVADATPVPGLSGFVGIAQAIVDSAAAARTNRENAFRIAIRVCEFLQVISEQPNQALRISTRRVIRSDPQIDIHVEKFHVTLRDVEISITQITQARAWYKRLFFVFRDKRTVDDNLTKLNDAVELYRVHALKINEDAQKETTRQIKVLQNDVNEIGRKVGRLGRLVGRVVQALHKLEDRIANALSPHTQKPFSSSRLEPGKIPQQIPRQRLRRRRSKLSRLFGVLERKSRPYRVAPDRNRFSVHRGDITFQDNITTPVDQAASPQDLGDDNIHPHHDPHGESVRSKPDDERFSHRENFAQRHAPHATPARPALVPQRGKLLTERETSWYRPEQEMRFGSYINFHDIESVYGDGPVHEVNTLYSHVPNSDVSGTESIHLGRRYFSSESPRPRHGRHPSAPLPRSKNYGDGRRQFSGL